VLAVLCSFYSGTILIDVIEPIN